MGPRMSDFSVVDMERIKYEYWLVSDSFGFNGKSLHEWLKKYVEVATHE